jgi:rhodanese-related sulfurtransferase
MSLFKHQRCPTRTALRRSTQATSPENRSRPGFRRPDARSLGAGARQPPDRRLVYAPLSQLARSARPGYRNQPRTNPPVVVICHHGVRSAEVAAWLLAQGWKEVQSLAGGLEPMPCRWITRSVATEVALRPPPATQVLRASLPPPGSRRGFHRPGFDDSFGNRETQPIAAGQGFPVGLT